MIVNAHCNINVFFVSKKTRCYSIMKLISLLASAEVVGYSEKQLKLTVLLESRTFWTSSLIPYLKRNLSSITRVFLNSFARGQGPILPEMLCFDFHFKQKDDVGSPNTGSIQVSHNTARCKQKSIKTFLLQSFFFTLKYMVYT